MGVHVTLLTDYLSVTVTGDKPPGPDTNRKLLRVGLTAWIKGDRRIEFWQERGRLARHGHQRRVLKINRRLMPRFVHCKTQLSGM